MDVVVISLGEEGRLFILPVVSPPDVVAVSLDGLFGVVGGGSGLEAEVGAKAEQGLGARGEEQGVE